VIIQGYICKPAPGIADKRLRAVKIKQNILIANLFGLQIDETKRKTAVSRQPKNL